MALPAHVVHAPAGLPVEEGVRPEVIEFGTKNLAVSNGRQNNLAEVSARLGFGALLSDRTDGTLPTVGYKMFADGQGIARITDGPQIETWDPKGIRWKQLGRVSEVTQRIVDLPTVITGGTFGAFPTDLVYCNGYFAAAWMAPVSVPLFGTFVTLVNASTGVTVRAPEQVGASTNTSSDPLLATYGVYIIAVWSSGAATISAMYLDTTTAASIALGWQAIGGPNIIADGSSTFVLQSLSDRVAIFYGNNSGAGTDRGTCRTFNITGVLQTQTINTSSLNLNTAIGICGSSADTLWLAWPESTLVCVRGLSPSAITSTLATKATILTMLAAANLIGIAPGTVAGTARIIANDQTPTVPTQLRMRSIVTTAGAAVASGTEVRVPGSNATQRPWQYGGRYYVTATQDTTQKTIAVVDWTDSVTYLRPLAVFAPSLTVAGVAWSTRGALRTCVVGPTASKLYFLGQITKSNAADATSLVELDYANIYRFQTAPYGNSTFLAGGILSSFDGVRVAELGFLFRPTTPTTAVSSTGISAATGWRYICVYEEVDADGNWHVSGLSNPSASTGVVANKTVTVSTQPLSITGRATALPVGLGGARIAVYRTLDGAVAPYYRVGTAANDTSAITVTFADNVTDAALSANAKLYEQPGVQGTSQDRRVPPGPSTVVSYNGMLVGASGSDVWSSAQSVSGEGAWFNPVWQVPVPGAGDITALAVMDGALFVFKRREVFVIAGDAPSDNAASGGLGLPRRLAADVGSIGPVVCTTAYGVLFQSDRGIEILTRAQTVEWLGQPYQHTLALFPIVTAMTVDPLSCTVLVECAAAQSGGVVSGNGRTLVYDLSIRAWIGTDNRATVAGIAASPAQSGCIVFTTANVAAGEYRYAWLSAAGAVHIESNGYTDADGSFVVPQFETAWLKHGLQQEQRVWQGVLLFQQWSAAGIKVETAYDYAAYSSADDKTYPEALVLGRRQVSIAPKSRGQAMKFRISATQPAVIGTGQSLTFIGLSFDMAPKQGAIRGTPALDPAVRK